MKSFSDYNPICIFVYYLMVLIPVMFTQNPVLMCMALLSGVSYYCIKKGNKFYQGWWMLVIPLIAMIINPLFNHAGSTNLFFINNNPITLESLLFGLNSGVMIAATLIWFSTFTIIMTSDKLLYVFGTISPKLALILSMTLRYIPLYKNQIIKTNNAQKVMGLYKDDNLIDKLRGGLRVFSVMVNWALENGVITADSMTARGYGVGKRSRFAIFKWTKSDKLLLGIAVLLGAVVIGISFSGSLSYAWYPIIKAEDPGIFTFIAYAAFLLLSLIPDYLQLKEELRWKYLMSKI